MKNTGIKLTILERDRIPAVLPPKGKREIGRLCVSIRQKVLLTVAEQKKYKLRYMRDPKGNVTMTYDLKKDHGETIIFTQAEVFLIGGYLRQAETAGALPTTEEWLGLYDKFAKFGKDADGRKKGKRQEAPSNDN
jgi:hypothetical protein